MNLDANDIKQLLAIRRSGDIFVPECKTSWDGIYTILDAWVMRRSLTHFSTIGYEIKVNRADFLNDNKWASYLPYCHEFYFVCPSGLIFPNELGDEAGLLWVSKTGTILYNKKKAPRRKIDIPISTFQYVLATRAIINKNEYLSESNTDYWKKWLNTKDENKELGYIVSKKIRQLVRSNIEKVNCENDNLRRQIQTYKGVKQKLIDLGIDTEYISLYSIERQIERVKSLLPEDFVRLCVKLQDNLQELIPKLPKT